MRLGKHFKKKKLFVRPPFTRITTNTKKTLVHVCPNCGERLICPSCNQAPWFLPPFVPPYPDPIKIMLKDVEKNRRDCEKELMRKYNNDVNKCYDELLNFTDKKRKPK